MPISSKQTQIILCSRCNGRGENFSHYKSYYKCKECDGSGRMIQVKFYHKLPFTTEDHISMSITSEIFDFFRKLDEKIVTEQYIRESKINELLRKEKKDDGDDEFR